MEVRIGVKHTPKEVSVDLPEKVKSADIITQVEDALKKDDHVLWLTDRHGRTVGIPGKKIAYVEIDSPSDDRKVGFAS